MMYIKKPVDIILVEDFFNILCLIKIKTKNKDEESPLIKNKMEFSIDIKYQNKKTAIKILKILNVFEKFIIKNNICFLFSKKFNKAYLINMNPVVRFAPSPTGMLHIGGARTALFNYLFAKKHNAKFILRIEDTDIERSTKEAVNRIINGLKILDIKYDEIHFQSQRINRHREIALELISKGLAYYDENNEKGKAVRLKIERNQEIAFEDLVRGRISFNSNDIEEYVLLRSDGTPTYMLSVVVDDIDMQISHIIRGDDHIGNTPKQILLYKAIGVNIPQFGHIPLIHASDGQKLSKRKNAASVEDYINLGYIPEAICNYLLHLGGGFAKDILSRKEAIELFEINKIGKSPSRLDFDKLNFINLHYIKSLPDLDLIGKIIERLKKDFNHNVTEDEIKKFKILLPELKKLNNINDITKLCILFTNNFNLERDKTEDLEYSIEVKNLLIYFKNNLEDLNLKNIVENIKEFSSQNNFSTQTIYQVIRFAMIGKTHSTSVKLILEAIQEKESKQRLENFLALKN